MTAIQAQILNVLECRDCLPTLNRQKSILSAVKDLSRFGKNYIEVGRYIDYIFSMINMRFIAINDSVDTADRNSTALDMMPIINLFNEWNSSSTSKKIRAVLEANAKAGNYMASLASYGYDRDSTPSHLPIINSETAPIVKRIFKMRSKGYTYCKIADIMNAENILTPSEYRYSKLGIANPHYTTRIWSVEVVKTLIHNPVYLGKLVQSRTITVSHKNHKVIDRDESEWTVVENTHESIISQDLWDKCLAVDKSVSRGKKTKKGVTPPLLGFCYCADCSQQEDS
jgi:hypothetical protein